MLANKILFKYGVVDGFGHVSVRCRDDPDHFWLARNCAPALVGSVDIIRHDLNGEAVGDGSHKLYLERFIHAAVYKRRQDVIAVVHSHSNTLVPFSVSKAQKLVPVWHMAGFLGHEVSIFDTAEKFGKDTDLLITDMDMADAMADYLVDSDVVLMRGHGATLCGRTLPEAVYRAICRTERADLDTGRISGRLHGTDDWRMRGDGEADQPADRAGLESLVAGS